MDILNHQPLKEPEYADKRSPGYRLEECLGRKPDEIRDGKERDTEDGRDSQKDLAPLESLVASVSVEQDDCHVDHGDTEERGIGEAERDEGSEGYGEDLKPLAKLPGAGDGEQEQRGHEKVLHCVEGGLQGVVKGEVEHRGHHRQRREGEPDLFLEHYAQFPRVEASWTLMRAEISGYCDSWSIRMRLKTSCCSRMASMPLETP